MTNLIEQYEELHNKVKERAIYINNLQSDIDVPDDLECFKPTRINALSDYIEMNVNFLFSVVYLKYRDPYESDWVDEWEVPSRYLEMEDQQVIKESKIEMQKEWKYHLDEWMNKWESYSKYLEMERGDE